MKLVVSNGEVKVHDPVSHASGYANIGISWFGGLNEPYGSGWYFARGYYSYQNTRVSGMGYSVSYYEGQGPQVGSIQNTISSLSGWKAVLIATD